MDKPIGAELDLEWVELIVNAKQIGLTIDEIREFLRNASSRQERTAQ